MKSGANEGWGIETGALHGGQVADPTTGGPGGPI